MLKNKFIFWGIVIGLFLTVFFYFPDFYASQVAPEGTLYAGHASWFDPWDINVYISAIKWSQHSPDSFQNAYTTIPHKPAVIYPFYTLLGILFSKIDAVTVFTISKLTLGFFLALTIYFCTLTFLKNKGASLLATLLICLGGGFGWLIYKANPLPDTNLTPFTFYATFQRSHEMLAVIFYLSSLALLFKGVSEKKRKKIVISASLFNIVTLFYPPYLLTYYLISFAFLLNQFRFNLKKAASFVSLIFLYTLPFGILYTFYLLNIKGFENVISPNVTTPHILSISLGYGIMAPIFIYQLFFESKNKALIFLNFWFLISILLAYLPLNFSRYYLRGLFFPLVLISIGLIPKISKTLKLKKNIVIGLFTLFLIPTSLLLFWKRMLPSQTALEWYYLNEEQKQAVEFLNRQSLVGEGVLASYPIANWIPARTKNRVYYGHHNQTPDSERKLEKQNKFYSGEFEEEGAKDFLNENYIRYVWCENGECSLNYSFLDLVFENEGVRILRF